MLSIFSSVSASSSIARPRRTCRTSRKGVIPSESSSPGLTGHESTPGQKPFVKQQLQEIRQEQAEKKAEKAKQQGRQHPTPGHSRQKKKKKAKGR